MRVCVTYIDLYRYICIHKHTYIYVCSCDSIHAPPKPNAERSSSIYIPASPAKPRPCLDTEAWLTRPELRGRRGAAGDPGTDSVMLRSYVICNVKLARHLHKLAIMCCQLIWMRTPVDFHGLLCAHHSMHTMAANCVPTNSDGDYFITSSQVCPLIQKFKNPFGSNRILEKNNITYYVRLYTCFSGCFFPRQGVSPRHGR